MMKVLCGILIVICLASCSYTQYAPPFSPTADMDSSYVQGRVDGERAYKAHPGWVLAGVGCGIFGVGYAWLVPLEPPALVLVNHDAEYILGYREGYQQKARSENTQYAALGWATWILILVAASAE